MAKRIVTKIGDVYVPTTCVALLYPVHLISPFFFGGGL